MKVTDSFSVCLSFQLLHFPFISSNTSFFLGWREAKLSCKKKVLINKYVFMFCIVSYYLCMHIYNLVQTHIS
jgi:hypothetical protein